MFCVRFSTADRNKRSGARRFKNQIADYHLFSAYWTLHNRSPCIHIGRCFTGSMASRTGPCSGGSPKTGFRPGGCSAFAARAAKAPCAAVRAAGGFYLLRFVRSQKSPLMRPFSSTSIFSAAGTLGRPGMVMIAPVSATIKPAPAETFSPRTVTRKSFGAPSRAGSSEKLYWVLAMQTGRPPKPSASSCAASFLAAGVRSAPAPW